MLLLGETVSAAQLGGLALIVLGLLGVAAVSIETSAPHHPPWGGYTDSMVSRRAPAEGWPAA